MGMRQKIYSSNCFKSPQANMEQQKKKYIFIRKKEIRKHEYENMTN